MWGPIIAAGIQAGGSLLGGMFGAQGASATNAQQMAGNMEMQREAQRFNAEQAKINREWQENMSNTAYQRAMGDMRAAGLNPILAANLGGASSPGGATASIAGGSPGTLSNPGAAMGAGVASAAQAGQTYAVTKSVLAQAEKDNSQTELNEATKGMNNATTDRVKQETINSAHTASLIQAQTNAARAQEQSSLARAGYDVAATAVANNDAVTAYHKSKIAEREAFDRTHFGQGPMADALGAAARSMRTAGEGLGDIGKGAWDLYSKYIGQPFARGVGQIVDGVRGGSHPGLTIDINRPTRR